MKKTSYVLIFLTLTIIFSACNLPAETIDESSFDKNGILTAAAQTVEAILAEGENQIIVETPVPTIVNTEQSSTEIPDPNDLITETVIPVEATAENEIACNLASFITDVTIKDGTDFKSGDVFIKIWRLKNIGSCTWTSDYELVFMDGYSMGGPAAQQLTNVNISPNGEVDISIELTAPITEGKYRGYWKLRSPDGITFSFVNANAFWVEIDVVP